MAFADSSFQDVESFSSLQPLTYNQAQEVLVQFVEVPKSEPESEVSRRGRVISRWMKDNATQVTTEGIVRLHAIIREGELAVLFRSNHFSVVTKHGNELFLLVTDVGYLERSVVWEKLQTIDGDSVLYRDNFAEYSNFRQLLDRPLQPLYSPRHRVSPLAAQSYPSLLEEAPQRPPEQNTILIESDHELALQLQNQSPSPKAKGDHELAEQLHSEEVRAQQEHADRVMAVRLHNEQVHQQRRRDEEANTDCVLL
eukprot:TRINITY_DN2502_c0_g1_i3.p1 TRINITY_DN2502_c0_g1~~TRINITY_DN2502_c0_g1_i3.p1  ORF type:complete len:254 (+),score=58.63 TRINITY_DN2502_c0_g1_i3:549-1310(+)